MRKRMLSMLFALAMCVACLSPVTISASNQFNWDTTSVMASITLSAGQSYQLTNTSSDTISVSSDSSSNRRFDYVKYDAKGEITIWLGNTYFGHSYYNAYPDNRFPKTTTSALVPQGILRITVGTEDITLKMPREQANGIRIVESSVPALYRFEFAAGKTYEIVNSSTHYISLRDNSDKDRWFDCVKYGADGKVAYAKDRTFFGQSYYNAYPDNRFPKTTSPNLQPQERYIITVNPTNSISCSTPYEWGVYFGGESAKTQTSSSSCSNGHTYRSANGHKCTVCGFEYTPTYTSVNKTFYAVKNNVPVWSAPYSKSGTTVSRMSEGQSVYITQSFINSVGNLWYTTDKGQYIYSENLTDKNPNAGQYNATLALEYARNNYLGTRELCAGFVTDCLIAGGISNIRNHTDKDYTNPRGVGDLYRILRDKEGFAESKLTADGNYFFTSDNPNAKVGDVIIYHCEECTTKKYKHAVIISEIKDGKIIIAHTNLWLNNTRIDNRISDPDGATFSGCSHGRNTAQLLYWPK